MILDNLSSKEILNTTNYPGINSYTNEISEITRFTDNVFYALKNYETGETPYIDLLVSDIEEYKSKIRTLNENLNGLVNAPIYLMYEMRQVQLYFGILTSFPQYFKENMEV